MKTHGNSILRSAALVSVWTGLSRALGLVRHMLMAQMFGTSLVQSAFVVAFKIPNLFRRLFGEGALSAAFVPVFSESIEKEGAGGAWPLASAVMSLVGIVLVAIVVAVILLTSAFIEFVPLGEKAAVVLPLLRIMFPYMFFICMVAVCMAILNSFHHFLTSAATPVLLNVVWILTLFFICPRFGALPEERIYGVAWGVLAAGVIQLAVQFPALARIGARLRFSFSWHDERVARVFLLMGPAALGMGVVQINVMMDQLFALLVGKWAPAALSFAELVVYLPLGVFATALSTVLLPTFSRQAAQADSDEIKKTLNRSLRGLLFVMIPAATGLGLLAQPIVRLLFEWRSGKFDALSTIQTSRALIFYAPGLVAFGFYKVIVPVFYALQDTLRPVRVGVWAVGLNFLLNITFILTWPQGYEHAGLAFATVLSSAMNGAVLALMLHRRIGSPGWREIAGAAGRIAVCACIMGCAVWRGHGFLAGRMESLGAPAKTGQLVAVLGGIALGLLVYGACAALICRKETGELISSARRTRRKPSRRAAEKGVVF